MSVTVTIATVDRSSYLGGVFEQQVLWSNILGGRGTATFTLYLPLGFGDPAWSAVPLSIGQVVIITGPAGIEWGGTIDSWTSSVPGGEGISAAYVTVDITCASFEEIFDRRMTNIDVFSYNITAGSIVTALYNKYCTTEPVTLGTINAGATLITYVCNYQTLSSIFDDLAQQSDCRWYVDPTTQELNFLPTSALPAAPFAISDTAASLLERPIRDANSGAGMSSGGLAREFTDNWTRQDYRNRQWVRLSYLAFPPQVDNFVSTGIPGR